MSAPTTTSDKVINSSAGSKVRSAVRSLVILAAVTGIITVLYFWHTRPRRRVRVSERKAQMSAAVTEEAREIDAAAAAAAAAGSSSVFADESDQSGELVPANAGVGETPSRDDQPLASLLPRAMSGSITQSPVDTIATDSNAIAPTREADEGRARPNPRPRPRRSRSSRARDAVPGDSIVENGE